MCGYFGRAELLKLLNMRVPKPSASSSAEAPYQHPLMYLHEGLVVSLRWCLGHMKGHMGGTNIYIIRWHLELLGPATATQGRTRRRRGRKWVRPPQRALPFASGKHGSLSGIQVGLRNWAPKSTVDISLKPQFPDNKVCRCSGLRGALGGEFGKRGVH